MDTNYRMVKDGAERELGGGGQWGKRGHTPGVTLIILSTIKI